MFNIFSFTKKLAECSTYIRQLETKNRLLEENIRLTEQEGKASAKKTQVSELQKYEQRKENMLRPIDEMADYVNREFEFRHNVVRDSYEYRRRGDGGGWLPVDERQTNTIMNHVQDDGRVLCLKSSVVQRIRSEMAADYHPVKDYLDSIRGSWDGRDRVADLCRRINGTDYCRRMVGVWLRAMVAQWLGVDPHHANAVMLLLVSRRQGLHKSTFMQSLLPEALTSYYTDDFSLASKSHAERKLVEFAIINIDEFDKLPAKKHPELKSLMQTLRPSFVKAYKTSFNQLPRIASFVGTTNERQVLTDRTGSRRFLILEPDGIIDVNGIDHDQLYAQLLSEVEGGHRFFFTKEEEAEMQRVNTRYYRPTELERLFTLFYRHAEEGEEGQLLSGKQLIELLSRRNGKVLREVSESAFTRMLTRLGFTAEHHHQGNFYRVVAL